MIASNWSGAVRHLIQAGSTAITGNTPAVRQAVARILLQHGADVTPATLDRLVGATVAKIQFMQNLARGAGQVARGAGAVAPAATNQNRKSPIFVRNQ